MDLVKVTSLLGDEWLTLGKDSWDLWNNKNKYVINYWQR